MEEVHHQYSGGHAVWTCHIINTEEGVQCMATKTAQINKTNDLILNLTPENVTQQG